MNDNYICIDKSSSSFCFSEDEYGNPDCSSCRCGLYIDDDDLYEKIKNYRKLDDSQRAHIDKTVEKLIQESKS